MIPGELLPADGDLELNAGLERTVLTVANTGDRPIQVGSHYHFYEVNPGLVFEREQARGKRLEEVSREEFDDLAHEVGLRRHNPHAN